MVGLASTDAALAVLTVLVITVGLGAGFLRAVTGAVWSGARGGIWAGGGANSMVRVLNIVSEKALGTAVGLACSLVRLCNTKACAASTIATMQRNIQLCGGAGLGIVMEGVLLDQV